MNILGMVLDAFENQKHVDCNVPLRKIKIGKKVILEQGIDISEIEDTVTWENVMNSYEDFKYSTPGENHIYAFYAKPYEELTDEELVTGIGRSEAYLTLACKIITGILTGQLKYPGKDESFFYASEKDKDFVLLKKWFNN